MARYQVILAYDGTEFHGFQRQNQARTVQGVFEDALRRIGWKGRSILAAGRTDTGVHALGQVVAFDFGWRHSTQTLQAALNANLPPDTAVQQVRVARDGFQPRFEATARLYRYRLFCREVRQPLRERYAWRVWPVVNLKRAQEAADCLRGVHDFAAFGRPPEREGSTIRQVFEAQWRSDGSGMVFEIAANAFLFRMVRRITAALVAVGQGRIEVERIAADLKVPPPEMYQGLAPPQGLTLVEVRYPQVNEKE